MHGLLCFLLFAGALHVDLGGLLDHRWTIAALSTVGVLISVAVVGTLTWFVLDLLGLHQRLLACLTFGALISPTDPVAVMGLLKELRAPASLEAQIAGESLFNDGVGVVVFLGLASMADLSGAVHAGATGTDWPALAIFALREVAGGIGLGLALGYVGYRALKSWPACECEQRLGFTSRPAIQLTLFRQSDTMPRLKLQAPRHAVDHAAGSSLDDFRSSGETFASQQMSLFPMGLVGLASRRDYPRRRRVNGDMP